MNDKIDKSTIIYTSVTIAIFVICIILGWNIADVDKQDVIKVFENQIISAKDNNMAKLLDNTYIDYTDNEKTEQSNETDSIEKTAEQVVAMEETKEAYDGEKHVIITTSANIGVVNLEVRYNETGEIVILEYSNAEIGTKILAIVLACLAGFVLTCIWTAIFYEDIL